jgi:hypothetical protein
MFAAEVEAEHSFGTRLKVTDMKQEQPPRNHILSHS